MTPLKKIKRPDIAQPAPVPEIREHAVPLPDPQREKVQRRRWDWYMKRRQWRDYITKERKA